MLAATGLAQTEAGSKPAEMLHFTETLYLAATLHFAANRKVLANLDKMESLHFTANRNQLT